MPQFKLPVALAQIERLQSEVFERRSSEQLPHRLRLLEAVVIDVSKPVADRLHEDESAFDEMLAHGRAIRQADRPTENQSP